jgi:hypothetical protein
MYCSKLNQGRSTHSGSRHRNWPGALVLAQRFSKSLSWPSWRGEPLDRPTAEVSVVFHFCCAPTAQLQWAGEGRGTVKLLATCNPLTQLDGAKTGSRRQAGLGATESHFPQVLALLAKAGLQMSKLLSKFFSAFTWSPGSSLGLAVGIPRNSN